MMRGIGSRLDFHVCKTLADLRYGPLSPHCRTTHPTVPRTNEIFDIIVDYPDSRPALDDLKVRRLTVPPLFVANFLSTTQECLQRVDQRSQLVQSLRKAYV